MSTDPAALLPLAEECGRAGKQDQIQVIRRAIWELYAHDLITREIHDAALTIVGNVCDGVVDSACLLGAAMMLVPDGHSWFVSKSDHDLAGAQVWKASQLAALGTHAEPALALTIACLRAHAFAADDGGAGR